MTHTPHVDPVEFTASDASLWTPRVREREDTLRYNLGGHPTIYPCDLVVMTGHQAGFWHCGILAKTLAAEAFGDRLRANQSAFPQLAHVVVDQDDNDAGLIEYPSRDASGAIVVKQWRIAPHAEGMPTGLRKPVIDVAAPTDGATDFVNRGLQRIADTLRANVREPSLAMQMARAAHDVIAGRCPDTKRSFIDGALQISTSDAFAHIIERILSFPRICVEAYNRAASEFPAADIRPLALSDDEDRIELPIWRITTDGLRVNARVADVRAALDANNLPSLAPKALLMTAFLRVFACDLFIHGTGGGAYDKVMERWLELWPAVGEFAHSPFIAQNLAPAVVATATVRLPLLDAPVPTAAEVARARWLAHAARHNPALLNDPDAAHAKDLTLAAIRSESKPERLTAYRTLHADLLAYREEHADELARVDDAAESLVRLRAGAGPALRRTWPFPLAPHHALAELDSRVRAHFT
jgi:hypothetical protein